MGSERLFARTGPKASPRDPIGGGRLPRLPHFTENAAWLRFAWLRFADRRNLPRDEAWLRVVAACWGKLRC